jgi:hypothetical protein
MPIKSRAVFAKACVEQGLFLGVNAHYLMAVAELRSGKSGINDDTVKDDKQVDRVGPFRVTAEFWDANRSDAELEIILEKDDINHWRDQCLFAALNAYKAQMRLLDQLGRFPSAFELYEEQWPNEPVEIKELQAALDSTKALVDPATIEVTEQAIGESTTLEDVNAPAVDPPPDLSKPIKSGPGEDKFVKKAPEIMGRLIADFGLKDFQAAGILGNIGHECNGFNSFQEIKPLGGGNGGFGWCQWTGSRRDGFETFCKEQGLDSTSDAANYGNLKRELLDTHKSSLTAVRAVTTIGSAVREFERKFEIALQGHEHFDRRDHWAQLALDTFKETSKQPNKLLPPDVLRILDPDLTYRVSATAKAGGAMFWVVDQFSEQGGQTLIKQVGVNPPEILAHDTTIHPLKAELALPQPVRDALSAGLKPVPLPGPTKVVAAASDDEVSRLMFDEAKKCDGTLVTRDAPNTNGGRVACAWAVNTVSDRALGKQIGGHLSTTEMGRVLEADHRRVEDGQIGAGMICISPTQGKNVGHVGIVGEIKNPLESTLIYSNSSSRGVFAHAFTVGRWKTFYSTRKGLPVLFYALKKSV